LLGVPIALALTLSGLATSVRAEDVRTGAGRLGAGAGIVLPSHALLVVEARGVNIGATGSLRRTAGGRTLVLARRQRDS